MTARLWSSLLIVLSLDTAREADWLHVAETLALKHRHEAAVSIVSAAPGELINHLRAYRPRFVAFVMRPEEVGIDAVRALKQTLREVDDDPFEDALWGIVTGPTAADAQRIASSQAPCEITRILATTGVDAALVPGPVTVLSDANPPGEWWEKGSDGVRVEHRSSEDLSHVFADAWNRLDPDLLLTSSHASERNLEMPFSRGNIVPRGGRFATAPRQTLIDYATGQAKARCLTCTGEEVDDSRPLAEPVREKVWLAAGNCLIANHLDNGDMVMTALGFGKVNQFVGYMTTTWFGEIGWTTWRYFGDYGLALNESYYAANQRLLKRLADGAAKDEREHIGLLWDRDATVFYGDPMHRVRLPARVRRKASAPGDPPLLILFPEARPGRRLVSAPDGFDVFVADDFAFVLAWPELPDGDLSGLTFDEE